MKSPSAPHSAKPYPPAAAAVLFLSRASLGRASKAGWWGLDDGTFFTQCETTEMCPLDPKKNANCAKVRKPPVLPSLSSSAPNAEPSAETDLACAFLRAESRGPTLPTLRARLLPVDRRLHRVPRQLRLDRPEYAHGHLSIRHPLADLDRSSPNPV